MATTRSIHLGEGVLRSEAANEGTRIVDLGALRVRSGQTAGQFFVADVPEMSFEALFRSHIPELAAAHAKHANEPGVLVAAVVPGYGMRAHLWLAADARLRSAIVGRHERADLFLPDDPALSLRHLAVLVRAGEGGRVRVRVLDLRTGAGFLDEAGRRLGAVAADGPLFVRASAHRFFLLPTGPGCELPEDADAAWRSLPPRRFEDDRPGAAPIPREPVPAPAPRLLADLREPTVVTASASLAPPEFLELVEPGEPTLGHLRVESRGRTSVVSLGEARAARGVLVGRYDRCDGVCPAAWLPDCVSRVHAFLLLEGGVLHVIDAGSTNGTLHRGRAVRCEPMPAGERVAFASASLVWDPAN